MKKIKEFCKSCGAKIKTGKKYCPNCGRSICEEHKIYCLKCGAEVTVEQTYCSKCGHKVGKKKNKFLPVFLIFTFALCICIGIFCVYKSFTQKNYLLYLQEGNYKKAYDVSEEENIKEILLENLISTISLEIKKDMKIEESFKLIRVWWNGENDIVIKVQGENNIGGKSEGYYYYYCDDKDICFIQYITDFTLKPLYTDDIIHINSDNYEYNQNLNKIKSIVDNGSYEINMDIINRVNDLSSNGKLEQVVLLDEIKQLFNK